MRCIRRFPASRAERLRASLCAGAAMLMLGACDRPASHPGIDEAALPELVPARQFVFNSGRHGGFSFSPDGRRLAWEGESGWRSALHVHDERTRRTHVYRVGGSARHWSADGRRLLVLDDKSGAENHRLYRLDVEDPDARLVDLTPFPGVRVWLHQVIASDPEHVLVLHNRRSHTLRDLYRIELATGKEELVAVNPGDGIAPVTDASGALIGWQRARASDRSRAKPLAAHQMDLSSISARTPDVMHAVVRSPDHRQTWVLSNRGRDRVGLLRIDAGTPGAAMPVHEDERADLSRVGSSELEGRPLWAASVPDYPRTVVFDRALETQIAPLLAEQGAVRLGYEVVSMSPDEQRMVVTVYTHANRRHYLVDRGSGRREQLGDSRSAEFQRAMVIPQPIDIRASDGLRLPAYLLRPAAAGGRKLPLVLLVHGGPWLRVAWSDPDHSDDLLRAQFLANRGYAVLIVNYRGSSGYGRAHMAAAVGQFGKAMQQDLFDAVQWAVDSGIADPARIAVMGHSYGGYASLLAAAQRPGLFACAVSVAGPTDLPRLMEGFPPYWDLQMIYWYAYVGDPAVPGDRERMQAVSPLGLAQHIERPVLLIQGGADVRVPPDQSRDMVARLRSLGKEVQYVEIPQMGHSLSYWAHHLAVLRRSEAFLADCLGGRSARFDALEWVARLTGRSSVW